MGFEIEAFAIANVMRYIRPPVNTVAIGQAFGAAAMILSQGEKGGKSAFPNTITLLNQLKLQGHALYGCELIAQATGKLQA